MSHPWAWLSPPSARLQKRKAINESLTNKRMDTARAEGKPPIQIGVKQGRFMNRPYQLA